MIQDIKELNFSYLVCMREAAIADIREAAVRFGVDTGLLKQVVAAPISKLHELADPTLMIMKPRMPEAMRSHLNNEEGSLVRSVVGMITEARA